MRIMTGRQQSEAIKALIELVTISLQAVDPKRQDLIDRIAECLTTIATQIAGYNGLLDVFETLEAQRKFIEMAYNELMGREES